MTALLAACSISCALMAEFGLDAETAERHAFAAEQAADEGKKVDAELLLAVAYAETRFRATDITYACKRGRCAFMCGVGQSRAKTKRQCYRLQPLDAGYRELARELAWWIKNQRGDLMHAAAGHGCGFADLKNRTTSLRCGERGTPGHRRYRKPYPNRVSDALKRVRARRSSP